MQLGWNSEVAAAQEIAAAQNDLTSNLITTFVVLVSRIMKDNESFCSPILFAKPHPKRHIRP